MKNVLLTCPLTQLEYVISSDSLGGCVQGDLDLIY